MALAESELALADPPGVFHKGSIATRAVQPKAVAEMQTGVYSLQGSWVAGILASRSASKESSTMKREAGIVPFLLLIGCLPAAAGPINYAINFTLTSGSPLPTSGSFTYNSLSSTFTNFDIVFSGYTLDLTVMANSYVFVPYSDPCYAGSTTGSQEMFLLLTSCSTDSTVATPVWNSEIAVEGYAFQFMGYVGNSSPLNLGLATVGGAPPPYLTAFGGFQAAATPEPGTCALLVAGLCLVTWKRIAHDARKAAGEMNIGWYRKRPPRQQGPSHRRLQTTKNDGLHHYSTTPRGSWGLPW